MPKHPETPAVILVNPKYSYNVGGVLRMCSCFGVKSLLWTGHRVTLDSSKGQRLPREERMKGYADVRVYANQERPLDGFEGHTPVVVELVPGTQLLPHFPHPKNPVYIFGPEDGSVPQVYRAMAHHFVAIPTAHCLNLSNACGLVLYDRLLKQMQSGEVQGWTMDEFLKEQRGWFDPGNANSPGIEGLTGVESAALCER